MKWCKEAVEQLQDKSMVIAIEELAELQQAISKGIRGKLDYDNLTEEIADVMLVLEWVKHKYNVDRGDIEHWLQYKKDRIEVRLRANMLD